MVYLSLSQLMPIVGLLYVLFTYICKKRTKHYLRENDCGKKFPPRSKLGVLETINMMLSRDRPFLILEEAKKLQSYIFQLNTVPRHGVPMVVIVGEPKLAREILIDPLSTKTQKIYQGFDNMSIGGVASMFTTNGQYWHSRRKGLSPAFSSKHIQRMKTVALQKIDEWIEARLSTFINNDQAFDVGKELMSVMFDALVEAAFQYKPSAEEKENYLHNLDICYEEFAVKEQIPLRKTFGLFFAERRRAFFAAKQNALFALKIINAYRRTKNPIENTIIDRMMKNNAYENDRQRIADINFVIFAGHDTTALTITFILIELARHPKEQAKLQEFLKSYDRGECNQSHVLRNIVKEGMRLFPVTVGSALRNLGRDFVTDDGLFLPKGSIASLLPLPLFRNSDIFYDADSFIPSRWNNPTKEMEEAFIPFAAGKQNCVGQSLANVEICSIVSHICSKFELEIADKGHLSHFFTLQPVNCMIKATKLP